MYFKILSEDLTDHGCVYHTGLNTAKNPFNEYPGYNEGISLIDESSVYEHLNYGTKISKVTIPKGEKVVRKDNIYITNRIIIETIKDFWAVETLKWLNFHGIKLESNFKKIFHQAIKLKNIEVIQYLLNIREDVAFTDEVALRLAVQTGCLEIVKCLVNAGADIHANNEVAFRFAAEGGHMDVMKYLVGLGADIHAKDDYALHWAAGKGHLDIVKYLIKIGVDIFSDNGLALCFAARYGQLEIIKYLAGLGIDIHINNDEALYSAIEYNHLDIVEYLSNEKNSIA